MCLFTSWFGLESLRKKLSGSKIQTLLSKLRSTFVTVSIPKMKIETDFELKKALIAMNITEMFLNSADLSGISKTYPLKVSKAAHRALIEVSCRYLTPAYNLFRLKAAPHQNNFSSFFVMLKNF
ncbi:hypothetical protein OESDEN_20519 [Oesophagostomum dentatum]|uniref:Serpin domain-containing protein n=1 Tax=Oesophagostomum dentatum TaxID=61180 RepID=A0A0B1S7E1_OESDE|nr:hypothetical protein OESDEN_20519 [Oesophagostomum dentatum]